MRNGSTKLRPLWMKLPYESSIPPTCREGRILLAFFCETTNAPMQEQFGPGRCAGPDAYRSLLLRSYLEEYHGRFRRGPRVDPTSLGHGAQVLLMLLLSPGMKTALWEAESGDLGPRGTNRRDCPQDSEQSRRKAVFLRWPLRGPGNIEQAPEDSRCPGQGFPRSILWSRTYSLPDDPGSDEIECK